MNIQWTGRVSSALRATALVVAASLMSATTQAQPAAATPSGPRSVGTGILHVNIGDLDRSLTLYRDVLGMEVVSNSGAPRAFPQLVTEPGALMRNAVVGVPGGTFRMELVEWSGTEMHPAQPRIQDPGALMLAMGVKDVDALLAGVKKLGLKVLSTDGKPVAADGPNGRTRSVMVRDADGLVVEFVEGGSPPATPTTGPINNVSIYISVNDLAQTVTFYNKVFGFTMAAPAEARPTTERVVALFDNKKLATMRTARGTFPGSELTLNFQEFRGEEQSPLKYRVQDAGGPVLLVQVQEFPAVVDLVRANGGIVGVGPQSETLAPDARSTSARDPNGVLLQLSVPRAPAPAAATPARP